MDLFESVQVITGLIIPHCLKVTYTALQLVIALRECVGNMHTLFSIWGLTFVVLTASTSTNSARWYFQSIQLLILMFILSMLLIIQLIIHHTIEHVKHHSPNTIEHAIAYTYTLEYDIAAILYCFIALLLLL